MLSLGDSLAIIAILIAIPGTILAVKTLGEEFSRPQSQPYPYPYPYPFANEAKQSFLSGLREYAALAGVIVIALLFIGYLSGDYQKTFNTFLDMINTVTGSCYCSVSS